MNCTYCGLPLPEGTTVCPRCGVHVNASAGPHGQNQQGMRPAYGAFGGPMVPGGPGGGPPGSAAGQQPGGGADGPRRKRTFAIIIGACATAMILGVALALILNATVLGREETTGTPPSEGGGNGPSPAPASPSPKPEPSPTPTPAPDFEQVFADVQDGVVRVFASTCAGTGVGSGFLVDDRTVITSLPAVTEAVAVAVVTTDGPQRATVTSADPDHGVAVLTLDDPVSGHFFTVKEEPLEVGAAVAAVGIPDRGTKPALAEHKIAEIGVTGRADRNYPGMARVSGAPEMALGGAPVVDGEGAVVGLMISHPDLSERLIMPGELIAQAVSTPTGKRPKSGSCDLPTGDAAQTVVTGDASKKIKQTLSAYFQGLNEADYQRAYDQLGPGIRQTGSLDDFAPGWVSSYDFNVVVESSSGNDRAYVTFDSIFQQGKGPEGTTTCARWAIDYTFLADGGKLLINKSDKHGGNDEFFTPC